MRADPNIKVADIHKTEARIILNPLSSNPGNISYSMPPFVALPAAVNPEDLGIRLLVEGFGIPEKETVEQLLDTMEVDEEAELEFPVVFRNKKTRLRFKLFMCDEGAVDLFVFTVQPLSDQIQDAMSDENDEDG